MTRASIIAYWGLALFFAWGLAVAVWQVSTDEITHWRFPLWWAALIGAHLARVPLVPLLYLALLADGFNGLMLFIYAVQPSNAATLLILIAPLIPLALSLYVWRRGHYNRPNPSKGDPHGNL